jgi:hypothetical protein
VLAGCGHGEPFQVPAQGSDGPLVPGPVARLTYSAGRDQSAAWRVDGSGILYTYEDLSAPVRGWCLGVLPAAGGSRVQSRCGRNTTDSIEAWDLAAESGDGRVAFTRARSLRAALAPGDWALVVGPAADPGAAAPVLTIPTTPPSGPAIRAVGQVAWLEASTLVVLGQNYFVGRPTPGAAIDTIATGRLLYSLPAAGGTPAPMAGTDYVSSVAVRGPDEILFTVGGRSTVYRRALAAGTNTPFLDFTGQGIVRDVSVAGDLVALVVGGNVTWGYDANVGDSTQVDAGGQLVVVNLVSGDTWAADASLRLRRPALAPDGRHVVVQTAARPADLYLLQLP